jgi:murein L,D-transpeptidase YafK
VRSRLGRALALGLLLSALGSCRQTEWKEAEQRSAILGRNVPAESLRVEIAKGARTLTLWSGAQKVKDYPVVLGRNPEGRKLHEGDFRTPEGEYVISSKYKHPRWQWFMGISYPNDSDRAAYEKARQENRIPVTNGQVAGIGGSVGIHGTASDALNKAKEDWTFGCISLLSSDVKELAEVVKVGTKVEIKP